MVPGARDRFAAVDDGGGGNRTHSARGTRFTVWPGSPAPALPPLVLILEGVPCAPGSGLPGSISNSDHFRPAQRKADSRPEFASRDEPPSAISDMDEQVVATVWLKALHLSSPTLIAAVRGQVDSPSSPRVEATFGHGGNVRSSPSRVAAGKSQLRGEPPTSLSPMVQSRASYSNGNSASTSLSLGAFASRSEGVSSIAGHSIPTSGSS